MSEIASVPGAGYPAVPGNAQGIGAPAPAPAPPAPPAADPDHDGDHDTPGAIDVDA